MKKTGRFCSPGLFSLQLPFRTGRRLLSTFSTSDYQPVIKQSKRIVPVPMNQIIEPRRQKLDNPDFHALFTSGFEKLRALFDESGFEIRIAGGAVRDLLMGIRPADVDFASTATPTDMKELFEKNAIRMLHKRGEEHGTITCRIDDENFEITTLRVDKVCDGRRAEVEFTTEWQLDANRRDLTVNSLFLGLDGTVIDFFGGIDDIAAKRIRFVGDAEQRIQEDYLRILRYFRFFGRIADTNEHDPATIEAIKKNRDGLLGVSPERIWTELKRIVVGRRAPDVLDSMLCICELHPHLGLPPNVDLQRFRRVYDAYGTQVEPMTMVATLCESPEQIADFHAKTKLSNVERIVGEMVVGERKAAEEAIAGGDDDWWHDRIVELDIRPGHETTKMSGRDRVLQLAMGALMDEKQLEALRAWQLPVFPVKGTDLMAVNVGAGPVMRATLQHLYQIWLKSRFAMAKDELLGHVDDAELKDIAPEKRGKKRKNSTPPHRSQ